MRKKAGSKQSKVSRIDRSKALAAQADEAIKARIRTAPAVHVYQPVPGSGTASAAEGGVMIHGIKTCVL